MERSSLLCGPTSAQPLYPPDIQVYPALCPLRKEDFCPFMLWVTLPRDYVKAMMNCTLETGWNFGMVSPDVAYMGEHFIFAFSPRLALLLHAFNMSISQAQGTFRVDERYLDAPITVGFRPLWQDWQSNGRTLWNRYIPGLLCTSPQTCTAELPFAFQDFDESHFHQVCAPWFQHVASCTVFQQL